MAEYDGSIRIKTDIDSKSASAQLMSLENRITKTADKVASLRSEMDSIKNAQIPTESYTEIQKAIEATEKKLNTLYERQEKFLAAGGKTNSSTYKNMEYDIEQLRNSLEYAKRDLQDLVDSGEAFTLGSETQKYANLGNQLRYAEMDLGTLNQRHDELIAKLYGTESGYKRIGYVARNAFRSIGGLLKGAVSGISKFSKLLKVIAHKLFPSLSRSVKKSNGIFGSGLKNILKYGLGIRSLYVLFNKIRSAIKEGFDNLYNSSEEFKNSVDGLKASSITLKNSFAAAFAPIVEIAIPYIQRLLDGFSKLLGMVAQFSSAITGQKTYTKAIKQTTAALEDEEKASSKQLSGLDKLNNLTSQQDSGSGSTSMFEQAPIDNKFYDMSNWLKDMWKNSDFYDFGQMIGTKIKNALDRIDWPGIKEKAKKIGKSLATFVNGVFETDGLFSSIGRTIGEAINTGVAGAKAFLENTNFLEIGKSLAQSANETMKTVEWDEFAETVSLGIEGALESAIGFLDELDGELFADSVTEFFANIDWNGIIGRLGLLILEAFGAVFSFGNKLGQNITSGLAEFFRSIGWDSVAGFFEGLNEKIKENGDLVKSGLKIVIDKAKEALGIHSPSTVFAEMGRYCIDGFVQGVLAVVENVKQLWVNMKKSAVEAFDSMRLKIKGIVNGILGIVESLANGVVKGINVVIDALNNLSFDIPDWIPGIGGNSLGFNIPTLSNVSIPRLATGTVVPPNREFMAVLGDNKTETEVVSPLSTIKKAMMEAIKESGISGTSGDSGDIIIMIDGREVFRVVRKQAKDYYDKTGKPAFSQ